MTIVSNNIRFLRKKIGLTQEKLASRIGIKRSLLGAYEEARAEPRLNNLQNMAEVFGVSVDAIMNEDLTVGGATLGVPIGGNTLFSSSLNAPEKENDALPEGRIMPSSINKQVPPMFRTPLPSQPLPQNKVVQSSAKISPQEYAEGKKVRMLSVTVDQQNRENIEYVSQKNIKDYLIRFGDPEYLEGLPRFQLPMLPEGELYRAFESGQEALTAMSPGAVVVGKYVRNWYSLKDQQIYVLVTRTKGILCKKVTNHIQEKGSLLLTADTMDFSPTVLPVEDVLEIWEAKAFISMHFPDNDVSLQKLANIVMDLQQEVMRMKKER